MTPDVPANERTQHRVMHSDDRLLPLLSEESSCQFFEMQTSLLTFPAKGQREEELLATTGPLERVTHVVFPQSSALPERSTLHISCSQDRDMGASPVLTAS